MRRPDFACEKLRGPAFNYFSRSGIAIRVKQPILQCSLLSMARQRQKVYRSHAFALWGWNCSFWKPSCRNTSFRIILALYLGILSRQMIADSLFFAEVLDASRNAEAWFPHTNYQQLVSWGSQRARMDIHQYLLYEFCSTRSRLCLFCKLPFCS